MAYNRGNLYGTLTRAMRKAFSLADVSQEPQPILLVNNESLLSTNAANTDTVALIRANASDVAEIPGAFSVLGLQTILGMALTATARTATATGATTGTILPGEGFVVVTSDDANKIMILPAPVPGTLVVLHVAATGYELRSSSPTTVGINGGTGANVESAIGANVTAFLFCATTTNWKGWQLANDGTLTKVEVAA